MRWRDGGGELAEISPSELYANAGLVTEDRRGEGLFLPLSAATISYCRAYDASPVSRASSTAGSRQAIAEEMIGRLNIKVAGE